MINLPENIDEEIYKNTISEFEKCKLYDYENFNLDDLKSDLTKDCGIVYMFYTKNDNEEELKYIGKSTWKYFKTRLKSHFEGVGKGTQSKYLSIKSEKEKGNKVYFKYVQTNPIYLRNYIEEMLIEKLNSDKTLWNYKH